jgi:hypothetical protein
MPPTWKARIAGVHTGTEPGSRKTQPYSWPELIWKTGKYHVSLGTRRLPLTLLPDVLSSPSFRGSPTRITSRIQAGRGRSQETIGAAVSVDASVRYTDTQVTQHRQPIPRLYPLRPLDVHVHTLIHAPSSLPAGQFTRQRYCKHPLARPQEKSLPRYDSSPSKVYPATIRPRHLQPERSQDCQSRTSHA